MQLSVAISAQRGGGAWSNLFSHVFIPRIKIQRLTLWGGGGGVIDLSLVPDLTRGSTKDANVCVTSAHW